LRAALAFAGIGALLLAAAALGLTTIRKVKTLPAPAGSGREFGSEATLHAPPPVLENA
jgi:hypothetical protein